MSMDYQIQPVRMGGLVKEVKDDGMVVVHLHGRLGVITVPSRIILADRPLEPGVEMSFYFSYIEITDYPYDYDANQVINGDDDFPSFLGGIVIEVNDTAAKVEIMKGLGTIAVPRRWFFTNKALEVGQNAEFYFSPMRTIGKRDLPAESI